MDICDISIQTRPLVICCALSKLMEELNFNTGDSREFCTSCSTPSFKNVCSYGTVLGATFAAIFPVSSLTAPIVVVITEDDINAGQSRAHNS